MKKIPWKIVAMGCIALALVLGVAARRSPEAFNLQQRRAIDLWQSSPEPGGMLGPLVVERRLVGDGRMLALTLPECGHPLLVSVSFVGDAPPDDLRALGLAEQEWLTLFVYNGRVARESPRFRAHIRYLVLRAVNALRLAPVGLANQSLFTFHRARECPLNPSLAMEVSGAILSKASGGAK